MNLDWKHWALTHVIWIVAAIVGGVGVHSWIVEHDNRLVAAQTAAVAENNVANLRAQITQNNSAISTLQAQIDANTRQAQQEIAQLQVLVAKVKTAPQAATGISDISQGAITPKVESTGDLTIPAVQAVPLFQELAQGKQDSISLNACTSDLTDEKQIVAEMQKNFTAEENIVVQKQHEIDTLKKPRGFWHRVGSTLKEIGISAAAGFVVGHKF